MKNTQFTPGEIVSAFLARYVSKNGHDNETSQVAQAIGRLRRIEDQRPDLLAALDKISQWSMSAGSSPDPSTPGRIARDAIARARG